MKREVSSFTVSFDKKVFITESHPSVYTDPEYITKLDHALIGANVLK